jgi:hypothetical protein
MRATMARLPRIGAINLPRVDAPSRKFLARFGGDW